MGKKSRVRTKKERRHAVSESHTTRRWVIGIILGITFLAFSNSVFNQFAYDDNTFILENKLVRNFSNIPTVFTKELWFYRVLQDKDPNKDTGPTSAYYRPVFAVYQMVCWWMFEDHPFGWHVANILVHLLVVYLAFLILERITGDLKMTAIAAVLFAVHPLRSESIAWLCGISDPLLAVFMLAAFYLYMIYREKGGSKYLAGAFGFFLLAAFTKESAISLPIFIAAYEIFVINLEKPLLERIKQSAINAAIFIVPIAFYLVCRRNALGFWLNDGSFTHGTNLEVVLTIPLVICKYLGLLFWPVDLSLFHETPMVQSALSARFILPAVGLIALTLGMWPLRRSQIARFGLLWFAIHLLPVLNLRAFAEAFMVQERYVYLPSIGFSLLIALALVKVPFEEWFSIGNRKVAQAGIVAIICLLMTGKSLAQNPVWKDDMALYTHGLEVADEQLMPHYILGHKYIKEKRYDKAVEELEKCLEIDPSNYIVLTNLPPAHIEVYTQTKDRSHLDRAIELAEKGLSLNDRSPALWDTLGHVYTFDTELKNYARARAFFARALAIQPDLFISNFHMGATYIKEGDAQNGIRFLEIARQQEPEYAETYKFLAYAYSDRGRVQEAVEQLSRYLQLQPNAPDAARETQHLETLRARLKGESSQG